MEVYLEWEGVGDGVSGCGHWPFLFELCKKSGKNLIV